MEETEDSSDVELDTTQNDAYERAKESALATLEKGFQLGGGPYPTRDEIYDRQAAQADHPVPDQTDQEKK